MVYLKIYKDWSKDYNFIDYLSIFLLQGLCAFVMGLCVAFNDNSIQNYSKENLSQLIEKRVTIEIYCNKLGEISRHEVYAKAAKQPQIKAKHSSELLLEFEFCKVFKTLEGVIIQALGVQRDLSNGISELSLTEHENALLLQYKELIRDQDKKLQALQKSYNALQKENKELEVITFCYCKIFTLPKHLLIFLTY